MHRWTLAAVAIAAVSLSSACSSSTASSPTASTAAPVTDRTRSSTTRVLDTIAGVASPCGDGSPRYLGQGLSVLVPEGATSSQLRTDDPGPLHAAAGYEIDIDGVTFEVWRTVEQPPSSATSRLVDRQWLWSTGPVPELVRCLAESLTYDQVADIADD